MHPRSRSHRPVRRAALAALFAWPAAMASTATPEPASTPAPTAVAVTLPALFDTAWARQPEALGLAAHREAAQARHRAAQAWTPEPPALEAQHRTDRLGRNQGARELEVGVALPLWLPGERRQSAALALAQGAAVENRAAAARLRLAAVVRDAWWQHQRAGAEAELARGQLDNTRRVADDVARRTRAGELARADQHQADAAVAAAQAQLAQAEASALAARLQVQALAGQPVAMSLATGPGHEPEPDSVQAAAAAATHAMLAEAQDRVALASQATALLATQSRANPELTLATTRERGLAGEAYGRTVTLALRMPFGGGALHDSRLASARAEAAEAQAQLALDRSRLQAEQAAARVRVDAARAQVAAADRRATLARDTRGFFEKSFRLGETDLPTRLRVEAEAADAERQASRSRIELAAAVSAWRQALGLLPQ